MRPQPNPLKDGVDHINIYSQGETELGRLLSNFTRHPFKCEDGEFASIEGYWYWLGTRDCLDKEALRKLWGFGAKQLGRRLPRTRMNERTFKLKIIKACRIKLKDKALRNLLKGSTLPFLHYYVYDSKVVDKTDENLWQIAFWESARKRLQRGQ